MKQRRLGSHTVGEVGMGCAQISLKAGPDDHDGMAALRAALGAGITFFDTADVYNPPSGGAGHGELLLRRTFGKGLADVVVATKGGKYWGADGTVRVDASPSYLRQACRDSLARLGLDAIPLYFLHEPSTDVPFADSVGALADLRAAGLVVDIGLSNVTVAQLDEAVRICSVGAVQACYSPAAREHEALLDRCSALGIAFVPWGSLRSLREPAAGAVGDRFARVAARRGASVESLVVRWLLHRAPAVLPIPGCRRAATILDSAAGADLELTDDDWHELDSPGGATRSSA